MNIEQKFQTIILESNSCQELEKDLEENLYDLDDSGNLFIIANNDRKNGFLEYTIFDYIELLIKFHFKFINTIVIPSIVNSQGKLNNNIGYVLWLVKDHNKMQFIKDNIREKHIWKDVEWGKRKKNYNPKGKDPSNVWIPTIDDGKGKITKHIAMSLESIINRCISSTTIVNEKVLIRYFSELCINDLDFSRNIILEEYEILSEKIYKKIDKSILKNNINKELQADVFFKSSEYMPEIKDCSIDSMITSPPYWDLKNYFKNGQIGQESYQEYLDRLNNVWSETYRVLKDTGSMWININNRTKNKKPILISQDIIKACKKLGFLLQDIIIWHKSSGIPTHNNNLVDKHEYVLWFVKSKNFQFNNEHIENIKDYKNDLLNFGLIWNINRTAGSVGSDFIHPAIYPTKLIDRIINLSTTEGDIILDPFLGSGTSMLSALNNKRNFIGHEYNEGFLNLIKHRAEKENINLSLINLHINKEVEEECQVDIYR